MQQVVQEIKNLSIGFTSKKGEQISILKILVPQLIRVKQLV